jgi:hypothetical protein
MDALHEDLCTLYYDCFGYEHVFIRMGGCVDSVLTIPPLAPKYLWLAGVEDRAVCSGAFQQVVMVHVVLPITQGAVRIGE